MTPSRRDFLRSASAAAISAPFFSADSGSERLRKAIESEAKLAAFWPLQDSLEAAKSPLSGKLIGGNPHFIEGIEGGKALLLGGGFLEMGSTPELDTPELAIELLFKLSGPLPDNYDACLISKRAASDDTRWSVHIMRGGGSLGFWNGGSLLVTPLPLGPLKINEWHHLVISIGADRTNVWLDGLRCPQPGGFQIAADKVNRPLQFGASSPKGEELCPCALALAAIYREPLPETAVYAHIDALGWGQRRRDMEKQRLEESKKRNALRQKKLERRLRDPRLMTEGKPALYEGVHLEAIAFGVGGIGAGCFQMNGKAERFSWQISNNFQGGQLPDTFFAICAGSGNHAVVRALQTSAVGPFAPMQSLTLRAEYPLAAYHFQDPGLPVEVTLEAYSPLIPLDAKNSALPCGFFEITVTNPGAHPIEIALLGSQQNAAGWDGSSPITNRRNPGYGQNRSELISEQDALILHQSIDRDPKTPGYGDLALSLQKPENGEGTVAWTNLDSLCSAFTQTGSIKGPAQSGPTPAGQTENGALTDRFTLAPGGKRTVRFHLSWYFPNVQHGGEIPGWLHAGNRYTTWFSSALDLSRHLNAQADQLAADTRLFHETFYSGNLPYWLRDRLTSQLGVLRSKTCFWAKSGYFGAWEGCGPSAGCCAGNCTHVWHYAQAHARLFPEIARAMREETLGYQLADGNLPHRHPDQMPALDGQCGDIIGVWREHLCSSDSSWLKRQWLRTRRVMEQTIRRWDPDENGVLSGAQWNTLDGNLGGSTTWIGSLYLTALAACEQMARLQGENAFAERCRRIRESGARLQNETLWNGEYYIQLQDAQHYEDYGNGCQFDQLLGEWWAAQVGLPRHYPSDRCRTALHSLLKYNFRADFQGVMQSPRKFVSDEDAGLQMIQWPKGDRPSPTILYGDEVMSGFEYSAAATMIQHGMLREGLMTALAAHDRYDGRLRTNLTPGATASWGYSGNPFGDDECGKYYARAMSVWSLLLACQGFEYDGPAGLLGFAPAYKPENHRSFFSTGSCWGQFQQRRTSGRQRERIVLRYGSQSLRSLVFALPADATFQQAILKLNGHNLTALRLTDNGARQEKNELGQRLTLQLPEELKLKANDTLDIELIYGF